MSRPSNARKSYLLWAALTGALIFALCLIIFMLVLPDSNKTQDASLLSLFINLLVPVAFSSFLFGIVLRLRLMNILKLFLVASVVYPACFVLFYAVANSTGPFVGIAILIFTHAFFGAVLGAALYGRKGVLDFAVVCGVCIPLVIGIQLMFPAEITSAFDTLSTLLRQPTGELGMLLVHAGLGAGIGLSVGWHKYSRSTQKHEAVAHRY